MDEPEVDISGSVFDALRLGDDNCFLCGAVLETGKTREHVFPGWLQHRHNLWDEELTLLNGTHIRYAQLTIPCCKACNSGPLSAMENRVRTATEAGYAEAVKLEPLIIYQWLGKIFYGILRKELSLLHDRRIKDGPTIVPASILEGFSTLHLFLQSIRQPYEFPDGEPFSALVVNLHPNARHGEYNFRDSLQLMTVSLRTKEVGFIVALQDAGLIAATYGKYVQQVAGRKITLIQFDELYAKCVYQVTRLNRTPKFITATNKDPGVVTQVHMMPIMGLSSKPPCDEWVQAEYFDVLADMLQQSYPYLNIDEMFVPPNLVMTWMADPEGKLLLVDAEGNRIPAEE
jgi:hypothetical protein